MGWLSLVQSYFTNTDTRIALHQANAKSPLISNIWLSKDKDNLQIISIVVTHKPPTIPFNVQITVFPDRHQRFCKMHTLGSSEAMSSLPRPVAVTPICNMTSPPWFSNESDPYLIVDTWSIPIRGYILRSAGMQ